MAARADEVPHRRPPSAFEHNLGNRLGNMTCDASKRTLPRCRRERGKRPLERRRKDTACRALLQIETVGYESTRERKGGRTRTSLRLSRARLCR